jgi:hypothetical protein
MPGGTSKKPTDPNGYQEIILQQLESKHLKLVLTVEINNEGETFISVFQSPKLKSETDSNDQGNSQNSLPNNPVSPTV